MTVEVRTATAEERLAALRPIWHYFGAPFGPEEERAARMLLPEGRTLVALDDGTIVGGAGAFELDLTIPGGRVRAAGPTVVGVLPTHRRRGVLRELMRVQLDDVHARGEPLAVLWASEETIYGRFGYGLASLCMNLGVQRRDPDRCQE